MATASTREKPREFNQLVAVDLKEVKDAEGEAHTFLNILDVATRYSVFVRVWSKDSQEVADTFCKAWVGPFGPPEQIIHDQGGELFRHFRELLMKLGVSINVTATESPWQNGLCERHGQVLGEIVSITVETA